MIIVLIQVLYLLGKYVYNRYHNNGSDREAVMMGQDENAKKRWPSTSGFHEESKAKIRFSPPAYVQRYQAVEAVLTDKKYAGKLKKVVDFGCSELGFCLYLKNMVGVEEALFVDIDRSVLEMYKEKIRPLHADYLHRRSAPLVMRVLEGSATQQDKILENCDAVVCIELIEHLYPEPLTTLPFNIFGFIKPKVAVITTPNADFNVLFENMKGFRHPDHKFEWTREQFQDWAHNVVSRYPDYEVTFQGICKGPLGTEHLGTCSQMAVFHKTYDLQLEKVPSYAGLFQTVIEHEYPYEIDNRSDEEKMLDDAVYYIRKFASYNEDELIEEIPLKILLKLMKNYYISLNELKEVLENANWTIADREEGPVVLIPPPSSYSDHSLIEEDFLDHDIPGYEWEDEPGPPIDYYERYPGNDLDLVDEEDWENEPHIIVSTTATENHTEEEPTFDTEIADSTSSIYPEDVCPEDIVTESRSTELTNSTIDESIVLSSFSETKGSENSETARSSYPQTQASSINKDNNAAEANTSFASLQLIKENQLENSDSLNVSLSKNTSICSMYLEPSKMSEAIHSEDLTNTYLESTITIPSESNCNKKLKLNSESLSKMNENTFEEPKYTSSPHVSSSFACKKRKIAKQKTELSSSSSSSSSSNEDLLCTNDAEYIHNENDGKFNKSSTCSNESVIIESNFRNECSLHTNNSESPEKVRQYTGTIPKTYKNKNLETRINVQTGTKIERISPDTPESLPNSWSPEIMDSGYPNSNSPPDLSPEYDLSSIAHDRTSDSHSDSESRSIADAPRIGFFDVAEVENRDLANNNLDGEGNHMEAEENQHINDLRPLINVLENDLENENDIYVVRNGFPIWLLRILQRFDADGVGINLPMLHPPNENFGE